VYRNCDDGGFWSEETSGTFGVKLLVPRPMPHGGVLANAGVGTCRTGARVPMLLLRQAFHTGIASTGCGRRATDFTVTALKQLPAMGRARNFMEK